MKSKAEGSTEMEDVGEYLRVFQVVISKWMHSPPIQCINPTGRKDELRRESQFQE